MFGEAVAEWLDTPKHRILTSTLTMTLPLSPGVFGDAVAELLDTPEATARALDAVMSSGLEERVTHMLRLMAFNPLEWQVRAGRMLGTLTSHSKRSAALDS